MANFGPIEVAFVYIANAPVVVEFEPGWMRLGSYSRSSFLELLELQEGVKKALKYVCSRIVYKYELQWIA